MVCSECTGGDLPARLTCQKYEVFMESVPMWVVKLLEGGGTAVLAAGLIFAVWWITTKLNERRQDKLFSALREERIVADRQAREDRAAYTESIKEVTNTLVAEIHAERERVMKAHDKDSEGDRNAMKEMTNTLTLLVSKMGEQRIDDAVLHEISKAQLKATERLEIAINTLREKL